MGRVRINGDEIVLSAKDPRQEEARQRLLERGHRGEVVPQHEIDKTFQDSPVISLGLTNGVKGGIISVFNPYGKQVVSVQSNTSNEGAVYVMDSSGRPKNVLAPK
jgi:hypothetical protein